LKVLDLFCGKGGWSKAFADAGHQCTGIDTKNIGYPYRFIKADRPPCTQFSKVVQRWTGKCNESKGLELVFRTFSLIQEIKPKYWVIENVKGLSEFIDKPNDIVRYGHSVHTKSAYLWSNIGKLGFFDNMIVKKTNRQTFKSGDPELAKIPYELSYEVLKKINHLSDIINEKIKL